MMHKHLIGPQRRKGYTLIELLLYLGIASSLVVALAVFFSTVLQARERNNTIIEIEDQGRQALYRITQTIRNAKSINSPSSGGSSATLSLEMEESTKNPAIFDVAGGVLRLTEGAGSPVALTASRFPVSAITFTNLSRTGTPGTMRVQLILGQTSAAVREEVRYTQTFIGSASLR